ncbi:MAG: glycosyltransferase family 1 protein [Oscillatoriophycideae cyanobacterium NC_groundwater_1537_Pr4_S-0.65um_50_18]|nr:glycosyltransferase family 1 protein [Oscillatoriophycideae cyanobacterium NC_groundwater_1537_Pr4_S-0.65um_50_18]
MKAVIIGNAKIRGQNDSIPAAQLYPFFDNRDDLRRELGFEFQHIQAHTFAEIEAACQNIKADVFFVRPDWKESAEDAKRVMKNLRQQNPNAKIFFIDPFDQTSSRFFNVLPYVDRFLKYQCLKDLSAYTEPLLGGHMLTDRLVRDLGYDLKGWHVGSEVPVGYEFRIDSGWYISLTPRFKQQLFSTPMPWKRLFHKRDIDICCHVSYGPRNNVEWYGQHRLAAIEGLQQLAPEYKLSVSGSYSGERTVSSKQYFRDIQRSRIAFSPFGWGEVTFRDFEAVCYGCLLIKPSIEHIDVAPNIFIPGVTYVPVRWDYADLAEKCRYYLENPDAANQIIDNAREAYKDYFQQKHFVKKIASLLQTIPVSEQRIPAQLCP